MHVAHAVLYEWVDEKGIRHFSTEGAPPQSDAKVITEFDPNSAVVKFAAFIHIEAGRYMMGSPPNETGRDPVLEKPREVTIPKDYYIMSTEVTREMWERVMGPKGWDLFERDSFPATGLKFSLIEQFVGRLNIEAGAEVYRLPTIEEWEYACRAGTTTAFHTGKCLSLSQANIDIGFPAYDDCPVEEGRQTDLKAVASYPPNLWGLFDMHGNAAEICSFVTQDGQTEYVVKGGSYNLAALDCRSAAIRRFNRDEPGRHIGFRLVRVIP